MEEISQNRVGKSSLNLSSVAWLFTSASLAVTRALSRMYERMGDVSPASNAVENANAACSRKAMLSPLLSAAATSQPGRVAKFTAPLSSSPRQY